MKRISGPTEGSLGLHPAVYFYNEKGKHSTPMFLAIVAMIARALRDNNPTFFKDFTKARARLEKFLIDNKQTVGQAIVWTRSQNRVERLNKLIAELVKRFGAGEAIKSDDIFSIMGLTSRTIVSPPEPRASKISKDTKAKVLLSTSLKSAMPCEICGGLIDPKKSLSFDHKVRVREGGTGEAENVGLTHPYCNTGFKS